MTYSRLPDPVRIGHLLPGVAKPGRYTGGEWNSVRKDWEAAFLRVLLAYPDTYEIGISHLGLQLLYELINSRPDALAERAFAPWIDMDRRLREAGLPLFALESRRPIKDFDVVGFTLPYELTFTNILNMLDLSRIPLLAAERRDGDPLVIAGGAGAFNPEPLADFIDLFVIGDGEEAIHDLLDCLHDSAWRPSAAASTSSRQREEFLLRAAAMPGFYVPALYKLDAAGRLAAPPGLPRKVKRRFLAHLPFAPTRPVVPYVEAIHDRAAFEIMRGCARGCRFCQAGVVYRSVRERPIGEALALADTLLANTGYDTLGLLSLSSADHSQIEELVLQLARRHPNVKFSLPSLRVDTFSVGLARAIAGPKGSFTFAPEAGSQRVRDAINKHVTEDDALRAAEAAFSNGWRLIKLYFMIGLPGETMEDVRAIADLSRRMLAIGRRYRGHRAEIHVSVNTFSPKPHTPFQWYGLETAESVAAKQELLRSELRGIKLGWSDYRVSALETGLARGDRRLGQTIRRAWQSGAAFDAWSDRLRFDLWERAFDESGPPLRHYVAPLAVGDHLPWSHVDAGVSDFFLRRERDRSLSGEFTPDCHVHGGCSNCGYTRIDNRCREKMRGATLPVDV